MGDVNGPLMKWLSKESKCVWTQLVQVQVTGTDVQLAECYAWYKILYKYKLASILRILI